MAEKSVSEIISGALELFTRGPRGGKLRKARWITGDASQEIYDEKDEVTGYSFCALGALSAAAEGVEAARDSDFYGKLREAGDLVASCIPKKYHDLDGDVSYDDIPEWNDNLSEKRGFVSIKRAFCKALKIAVAKERKRAKPNTGTRKRVGSGSGKRNSSTK